MDIQISKDYEELSRDVAVHVARYIRGNPGKLLCFAAGDTPLGMFAELVKLRRAGEADLSSVWYVGLDEWAGLGYGDTGSCRQVMADHFYRPAGISGERVLTFDGKDQDLGRQCRLIDEWVNDKGGVGLTVLGVGMNGHVGFNEPGTEVVGHSVVVELDDTTLRVGRKYFGGAACPARGISLGMGQLLGAEEVVMMASGAKKAEIVRRAAEGEMTDALPASLMRRNPGCVWFLDEGAASQLHHQ